RQDQVQVVNVQFGAGPDEPQGMVAEAVAEGRTAWLPYLRYGVGILLFAVILLFVVRPLLTMLGSTTEPVQAEASASVLPGGTGMGQAVSANLPGHAQIIDMARKNPDTTAVVVKQWLKSPT
ncbi:MAG: hypothetical protein KF693_17200, partial [Nitrospira sp.]|nr:hypothetical protein [Nitrospira sp.]